MTGREQTELTTANFTRNSQTFSKKRNIQPHPHEMCINIGEAWRSNGPTPAATENKNNNNGNVITILLLLRA